MSQRSIQGRASRRAFLFIALAAAVAAIFQITLGGIVRVTESGLGCPDWPLCHGRAVPPLEAAALIEYSHRLSAVLLGVLVLASAGVAWRAYRHYPQVIASAGAAVALTLLAALLGAASVLTELTSWVVLLHLGVAELVVACVVVAWVGAWTVTRNREPGGVTRDEPNGSSLLISLTLVATFGLILSGSYMVGQGYGSACGTWPLCRGSVLPSGDPYLIHMSHRLVALLVGVLVIWLAASAWSRRSKRPDLAWASGAVAGLYLAQVLIGAATVWTGFSVQLKSLHLSVATLLWASLVALGAMSWTTGRLGLGRHGRGPSPALERMTP